jgi:hypothetical protein
MLNSSNLKYFQADLQKHVIDFGRRLIIQRKSESLAELQLFMACHSSTLVDPTI